MTANTCFTLKFPKSEISSWANRYEHNDDDGVLEIGERSRSRGYYTREDFLEVCEWKTRGRPRRYYQQNSDEDIRRVTANALSATDETTRLWTLVAPGLIGVQMPTASVLLHLACSDPRSAAASDKAYPIIDFRALWSLNCSKRCDTFRFWWAYVETCRALAVECGVSTRDLDRALWEYSNQNQRTEAYRRHQRFVVRQLALPRGSDSANALGCFGRPSPYLPDLPDAPASTDEACGRTGSPEVALVKLTAHSESRL